MVGVQQADHLHPAHDGGHHVGGGSPRLDDDGPMDRRVLGVMDQGGTMSGEQQGLRRLGVQRNGPADPPGEPRLELLVVAETGGPGPPDVLFHPGEHRTPESASADELLARVVDEVGRARQVTQAAQPGRTVGQPSGPALHLVAAQLDTKLVEIDDKLAEAPRTGGVGVTADAQAVHTFLGQFRDHQPGRAPHPLPGRGNGTLSRSVDRRWFAQCFMNRRAHGIDSGRQGDFPLSPAPLRGGGRENGAGGAPSWFRRHKDRAWLRRRPR
ncbi:hypothetical protein FRACA_20069 [Frankia canadensis]|uniref:Uncharacterized protein n=1 Tax=Frankia canadensis TaxID=1836972 RepID=A0A2I2KPS5_9ACTN|nr:hypothetical protein FRACA_20069 [Frankia canadensis]SOU54963.1 hypothetical protein FRACA_20069 [Frankia canadensis]